MDIFGSLYGPIFAGSDPKVTLEDKVPKFLDRIEPLLSNGGWLVGDKISIADFWIGGLYTNYAANPAVGYGKDGEWAALLAKYPAFEAYGKRFAEANKEWIAKRHPAPCWLLGLIDFLYLINKIFSKDIYYFYKKING